MIIFVPYNKVMSNKKRGRGRPPKKPEDTASERMEVRATPSERERYERAAELSGLSLSEWVRSWINHGADEELGK